MHFLALGDGGTNIPNPQATPPGLVVNEVDGITIPDNYNFNRKANEDWIQPVYSGTDTKYTPTSLIAAWDVSVGSKEDPSQLINGRLYTNSLNLTGPNSQFSERSFYHTFTVMTPSGYTYQVNTNGLNGASFNFFSNNKGVRSGTSTTSKASYASKNYGSNFSTQIDPYVWDPRRPDDGLENFTNKIFYNTPASDLPVDLSNIPVFYSDPNDANPYDATPSYRSGFGPLTTWLKTTPVRPAISDAYANCYGLVMFKANVARSYRILFDCNNNGDFGEAEDKIITGTIADPSVPVVYQWDRRNGNNNQLAVEARSVFGLSS